MYKVLAWSCLALAALPTMATTGEEDSQYRGWCTRNAAAEKISAAEREDYIQECIDSLVEADKNPESSDRKRKRNEEDDG